MDATATYPSITAQAHPNIALVKYWGKRAGPANVPAVPSLSITLDTLRTRTRLQLQPGLHKDDIWLDERRVSEAVHARLAGFLDLIRQLAIKQSGAASLPFAQVQSDNNFPTAAGLASSASGFAALAVAACAAYGLQLDAPQLSALARQGSGSAARSLFGGFVSMACGTAADGHDAYAQQLQMAAHWPLAVAAAITSHAQQDIGSTEGMQHTSDTSPFWSAWLQHQAADMAAAEAAVHARDFAALAAVAEHSCLKMHATAMAAAPGVVYWHPATLAAMATVRKLQQAGVPVFFTIDAGPQLKAVCLPEALPQVRAALAQTAGVLEVLACGLGQAAQLLPAETA